MFIIYWYFKNYLRTGIGVIINIWKQIGRYLALNIYFNLTILSSHSIHNACGTSYQKDVLAPKGGSLAGVLITFKIVFIYLKERRLSIAQWDSRKLLRHVWDLLEWKELKNLLHHAVFDCPWKTSKVVIECCECDFLQHSEAIIFAEGNLTAQLAILIY